MPVDLNLSTSIKRRFSTKTSLIGYAILLVGVAGICAFTLYSKGKEVICKPWAYPSTTTPKDLRAFENGTCSSTIVYSGQTFSSTDATFVWSALTWANYTEPANLENCQLLDGSRIQVDASIRSTPAINWNVTYVCSPSGPFDLSERVNIWEGIDLYPNSMVLTIQGLGVRHDEQLYLDTKSAALATRNGNSNPPFVGFEVYSNGAVAYMADDASGSAYLGTGTSDLDKQLLALFNSSTALALNDLQTVFSPVPNVLFPCNTCKSEWRAVSEIIWALLVGVGSLLGVMFKATGIVLEKIEPEPPQEESQESLDNKRESSMGLLNDEKYKGLRATPFQYS